MADGTGDLDSEEEQSEEEEDSSSENEEAADSCRLHVDAGIPLPPPPIGPRPGESGFKHHAQAHMRDHRVPKCGQDAARTCCQINKRLSI